MTKRTRSHLVVCFDCRSRPKVSNRAEWLQHVWDGCPKRRIATAKKQVAARAGSSANSRGGYNRRSENV